MRKSIKYIIMAFTLMMMSAVMIKTSIICYAHPDAATHDEELETALFGEDYSKYKSTDIKNAIQAFEYASNLCIDQFQGNCEDKYNWLKQQKMGGLPSSFSKIDYSTNPENSDKKITANTHRMYTHQGWERDYTSKGKNIEKFWTARRKVLLGTVNSVLDFDFDLKNLFGYSEECESFAGIIYYIHILGDYEEADNYKKITLLTDLAGRDTANDDDKDYDMITSLKKYVEVLFSDQESSTDYKELIDGLDDIDKNAGKLVQSTGGVNTDEEFEEYHQDAKDILGLLNEHLPSLLKNEDFFKNVFYLDC